MAGAPEYGPEKTPYFTMVLTCCAGCEDCTIRMRSCAAAENRLKRADAALDSQEAYSLKTAKIEQILSINIALSSSLRSLSKIKLCP